MHQLVVHQKPDPEEVIKVLFGTDTKGLARKILRGEVVVPKGASPDDKTG